MAGSRTDDSWGDGGGADDRCVGVLSWLAEASGTVNTWLARLVGVAALVLVSASDAEGATARRKKTSESSGGPYGGVYCLYGALRALGVEV